MCIYPGCRYDPQNLICLASSSSVVDVDGGRWCQVATWRHQEYIIEKRECPTPLCTVTTLYGGHDLYNDIHELRVSQLAL